jgi:hypothetical protein
LVPEGERVIGQVAGVGVKARLIVAGKSDSAFDSTSATEPHPAHFALKSRSSNLRHSGFTTPSARVFSDSWAG